LFQNEGGAGGHGHSPGALRVAGAPGAAAGASERAVNTDSNTASTFALCALFGRESGGAERGGAERCPGN